MTRFRGLNVRFHYGKIPGVATSLCWIDKGVCVGTQEGTIALY